MTLSLAAYQSMNAETTGVAWITLVTINHDDMTSPLYLALNNADVTSNSIDYTATYMDVILMGSEPGQVPEVQLRLDAVDGTILDAIDSFSTPLDVTLAVVLSSDWDTEVVTQNLRMTRFATDLNSLVGTLEGPDCLNEGVPGLKMNRRSCPNLFQVREGTTT